MYHESMMLSRLLLQMSCWERTPASNMTQQPLRVKHNLAY